MKASPFVINCKVVRDERLKVEGAVFVKAAITVEHSQAIVTLPTVEQTERDTHDDARTIYRWLTDNIGLRTMTELLRLMESDVENALNEVRQQ